MRRLLLLLTIAVLAGCPASYRVRILNEAASRIEIRLPYVPDYSLDLEPGESRTTNWSQPCLFILDAGHSRAFRTFPFEEAAAIAETFAVRFEAVYADGELTLRGPDGETYPVPAAGDDCPDA